MVVTLKRILIWCMSLCMFDSLEAAEKRPKRFIGGRGPLPSHDVYNTQYLVAMFETWRCVSEQYDHVLSDCDHLQVCTGSLIRPDFVLTACHCMVYEDYYKDEYETWIPPIIPRDPNIWEFPPYIVDRLNYGTVERYEAYKKSTIVRHPILNAMTLMAGHPVKYGKQRRHAAKFFPHHLCAARHVRKNPWGFHRKLWLEDDTYWVDEWLDYDMDIGLVKSCYPFVMNNDVQVAPVKPYDQIEDHLRKLLKEYTVCLGVGWGDALVPPSTLDWDRKNVVTGKPDVAHHDFRYLQCSLACAYPWEHCHLCDLSQGPNLTSVGLGDSGGPLVCEGFVTGVCSNFGKDFMKFNDTANGHVAVACVKEFITNKYLAYLRTTSNEQYHYQNGRPVRVIPENYPEDLNPIIFPTEK